MSKTVDITPETKETLKKFRFKRSTTNCAQTFKINKANLTVVPDESLDDLTIEELAEELPSNKPCYCVVSYQLTHKDGRTSNPLFLIDWSPPGCPPELGSLHASALSFFQQTADVGKVIQCRDGGEGLTTEAVESALLGN